MYDSITCNDVVKPMQTHPGKDQTSAYPYPRGEIAHRVSYDDSTQKQDRIVKGIHALLLELRMPVEHRKIHPIVHIFRVVDNTFIVY